MLLSTLASSHTYTYLPYLPYQGRVRDTPELRMKSGFRAVVDNFEGVDMLLTPSQSVVFRNIKPAQKAGVEARRYTNTVVRVRVRVR